MNGSSQVSSGAVAAGPSRLDSAIERITSNRSHFTSSRTNSVASSSRQSMSNMPTSADPIYSHEAVHSSTRRSMQSDTSPPSDANANGPQLYNTMPPPTSDFNGHSHRSRQNDDWAERGASRRIVHTVVNGVKQERVIRKGVRDFNFARTLGEGSYSTVVAATDRQTLKEYAIKVLDKRHIIKEKKVKYVNIEKNTLFRLGDHPGIVRLYYTFQDESSLYFVLDLAINGELLGVLKRLTTFDEECARYYSAQILDAIDYMHTKGVIHRDLKPENVLLDDKMRIKIADFGTAKLLDMPAENSVHDGSGNSEVNHELEGLEQSDRANSFVGTAEYVSPELLTEKSTCKSSDLWALGCILFQLLNGKPPFKASNEYQTFQKIVNLDYTLPPHFPLQAADLIKRLLVLNPMERLTVPEIRAHPFFAGIDWRSLWKIKAPKLRSYRAQPTVNFNGKTPSAAALNPIAPREPSTNSHTQSTAPTSASAKQARLYIGNADTPSNRNASAERLTPPRPRSHRVESGTPSELDLQYSAVLALPSEKILRLGHVTVMTSDGDKLPRKFNKLLQRKKTRTLMVTTHGRCLYLDSANDKKVRGEVILDGPATTTIRQVDERQWIVETAAKSYLYEDASGHAGDWMRAIDEANNMVSDRQPPPSRKDGAGGGGGKVVEEKRKSRIGFG